MMINDAQVAAQQHIEYLKKTTLVKYAAIHKQYQLVISSIVILNTAVSKLQVYSKSYIKRVQKL